jgi:hypothetical protein
MTPFLSLRGMIVPKQSLGGYEIATPRQVGARNDKKREGPAMAV